MIRFPTITCGGTGRQPACVVALQMAVSILDTLASPKLVTESVFVDGSRTAPSGARGTGVVGGFWLAQALLSSPLQCVVLIIDSSPGLSPLALSTTYSVWWARSNTAAVRGGPDGHRGWSLGAVGGVGAARRCRVSITSTTPGTVGSLKSGTSSVSRSTAKIFRELIDRNRGRGLRSAAAHVGRVAVTRVDHRDVGGSRTATADVDRVGGRVDRDWAAAVVIPERDRRLLRARTDRRVATRGVDHLELARRARAQRHVDRVRCSDRPRRRRSSHSAASATVGRGGADCNPSGPPRCTCWC